MKVLVICTGNPGKRKEIEEMLPAAVRVLVPADLGIQSELPETGATLEENALEKARHVHQLCGLPCMADDTGLEVNALNGRPGVYSARYAGSANDPVQNMTKLLGELEGVQERGARFRTVIAFVTKEGETCFEGRVEGHIAEKPAGDGGFGYDPLFIPEGREETFAQMDPADKNAIGHRGKAMARFLEHYRSLG